ncbi:MAG: S41 family peptidase [Actinomycetota bacterium]
MNRQSLIALLAALAVGLGSFSFGLLVGRPDEKGIDSLTDAEGSAIEVIQDAYETIVSTSADRPDDDVLARAAIRGMIRALKRHDDPFALFYTPNGYRSFQELSTGRFSGIGVWLKQKGKRLEIVSVLPSSPARAVGLERGDVIARVDSRPVTNMNLDEAVRAIKGRAGTEVRLGIDRDGVMLDIVVERAQLQLPNLRSKVVREEFGYVRLLGFARGAGRQVHSEVKRLRSQGAEGIILDLRDNGGGLFSEAIEVASVFIEDGEIVTYRGGGSDDATYDATGDAFEEVPLVVLVNEGTASASEIVAGALQDQKRGIIVGATTYGKGSVQEVVPLLDSSALKLTTGAYITPEGRNINGEGIEPDVVVDDDPRVQRVRAIEILRGIILSSNDAQG